MLMNTLPVSLPGVTEMQRGADTNGHKCQLCGKQFLQKLSLNRHLQLHITNPHCCTICYKFLKSSSDLALHLQLHDKKQPQCSVCGKSFSRLSSLQRHSAAVHSDIRTFSCSACGASFQFEDNLTEHQMKNCSESVDGKQPGCDCEAPPDTAVLHLIECPASRLPGGENLNEATPNAADGHISTLKTEHCEQQDTEDSKQKCRKKSTKQHNLRLRQQTRAATEITRHSPQCGDNNVAITSDNLPDAKNLLTNDPSISQNTHQSSVGMAEGAGKCHICGKQFFRWSRSSLDEHLQQHSTMPHYCKICYRFFQSTSSLTLHAQLHTEGKQIKCHVCDKSFTHMQPLQRHLLVHSDVRAFSCSACGVSYKHLKNLTDHQKRQCPKMASRTSEKSLELAQQSGTEPDSNHRQQSLDETQQEDVRRFMCYICDKRFLFQSGLQQHLERHRTKPHYCKTCSKFFKTSSELDMHLQLHTELKQLRCDVCGKTFLHIQSLERHSIVHSNTKPFSCSDCGMNFKYKHSLREHRLKNRCKPVIRIVADSVQTGCEAVPDRVLDVVKNAVTRLSEGEIPSNPTIKQQPCDENVEDDADDTSMDPDSEQQPDVEVQRDADNSYTCHLCGKRFSRYTRLSYNQHMQLHRTKPHYCKICYTFFKNASDLTVHLKFHTEDQPQCKICGKSFLHWHSLQRHSAVHSDSKPFICSSCGASFKYKSNWTAHWTKHCGRNSSLPAVNGEQMDSEAVVEITDDDEMNTLDEERCNQNGSDNKRRSKKSTEQRSLVLQQQNAAASAERRCYSPRPRGWQQTDAELQPDADSAQLMCHVCGKRFLHTSSCQRHLQIHSVKPHCCKMCYTFFSSAADLAVHLKLHAKRQLQCNICGKAFLHMFSLQRHSAVHSDVRPFSCSICGLGFKYKENWVAHRTRCETLSQTAADDRPTGFVACPEAVPDTAVVTRVLPSACPDLNVSAGLDAVSCKAQLVQNFRLVAYPLSLSEMSDERFVEACSRASEFGVSFIETSDAPQVGCALFCFESETFARQVRRSLNTIRPDLTVRLLHYLEDIKTVVKSLNPVSDAAVGDRVSDTETDAFSRSLNSQTTWQQSVTPSGVDGAAWKTYPEDDQVNPVDMRINSITASTDTGGQGAGRRRGNKRKAFTPVQKTVKRKRSLDEDALQESDKASDVVESDNSVDTDVDYLQSTLESITQQNDSSLDAAGRTEPASSDDHESA